MSSKFGSLAALAHLEITDCQVTTGRFYRLTLVKVPVRQFSTGRVKKSARKVKNEINQMKYLQIAHRKYICMMTSFDVNSQNALRYIVVMYTVLRTSDSSQRNQLFTCQTT